MSDQIMLRFLKAGLINVGGDDAKLERLRETAADLAATLKKTPSKAMAFALIAIDPEAPAEDPVIQEALNALQSRWATYANTFSGTPVAILRAVLLDAVVQAVRENDKIGVAFVALARNMLPFTEAENEQAIWVDVVTDIEKRVDTRAEAEWATPETINVTEIAFERPAPMQVSNTQLSINKAQLAKKFEAVAGPSNAQGQITGGNPHWPQGNAQAWLSEFGKLMADVIMEALGHVADASKIKPIDLSGPLESLARAVSNHVNATLMAVSGATAGLQRRTNLIWWKETLYSPSSRISYREMPAYTAAALMAFDLHTQVPLFSPASVAAFLHETVLSLPSLDVDESRPIRDLVAEASSSDSLIPLRKAAAELIPEPIGRGLILSVIGQGAARLPPDDRAWRRMVGLPDATMLKVSQWATWVFRELQAARAVRESTETKKRGRKI